MNAGDFDRKVTFERITPGAANGFNEPTEVWETLCQAWAKRMDVSDSEKVQAGEEGNALVARFRVRSTAKTRSLTGDDRMVLDGVWNIKGAKEVSGAGRRRQIEVTAVRDNDG